MKKGTGDDPFAEEADTDESDTVPDGPPLEGQQQREEPVDDHEESAQGTTGDLPYLPRRELEGNSVKDGRKQVPFFLRKETQVREREFRQAVEERTGQEVNKTDLREAAYVFAQRNPDGVADILQEWGIDYLG